MASRILSLNNVLTHPSKIASQLDWRKVNGSTILGLDIRTDRISVAVASHPSLNESMSRRPPQTLDYISLAASPHTTNSNGRPTLRRPIVSVTATQELTDMVQEHGVCGFVVAWPVQSYSGRQGAACGRVIFTLERLLHNNSNDASSTTTMRSQSPSSSDIPFKTGRPLCFWTLRAATNDTHSTTIPEEDKWGRSALYTHLASDGQTIHRASIEQYPTTVDTTASKILEDFINVHWPDGDQRPSGGGGDCVNTTTSSSKP